jgi:iron complex outermembrane receptor protein
MHTHYSDNAVVGAIARTALTITASLIALSSANLSLAHDHELPEVVVTGSREATALKETPAAIVATSPKQQRETKPQLIHELINQLAGVHMVNLGNEQHSMSIRQPISTNAFYQYLQDGVPIRPLGIFNHNALNEINLSGTERVEIIKGAASSLYGSNAVGATINFLTAPPPAPNTPNQYSIGARISDQGLKRIDTTLSHRFGQQPEDLAIRMAHYSANKTDGWQQHSSYTKDSLTLRADKAVLGDWLLKTTLDYTNLDSDMTGALGRADYVNTPGKSYNTFTYRKDKNTRLATSLEGSLNEGGMTTFTVFARDNQHDQNPSYSISFANAASTTAAGRLNQNGYQSYGFDIRHAQQLNLMPAAWHGRWITGIYADNTANRYDEWNLNITRNRVTGQYTGFTVGSKRRAYDVDLTNRALYSQLEFSPLQPLRVVIGARRDEITYDFNNNLTPSSVTGAPSENRSFARTSPKAGATWQFSPNIHGYYNWSQGFTPPEVSALYSSAVTPTLRPSIYTNQDLGLRGNLSSTVSMDAALFRIVGKDEIISYSFQPGVSTSVNAGKTRHQGIELGLNWTPTTQWQARLATRFTDHEYTDYKTAIRNPVTNSVTNVDFSGKKIRQAPNNVTTAEMVYRPIEKVRLSTQVEHVAKYWMNESNSVEYGGHTLLNLRANWQATKQVGLFAQVLNALDKRYSDSATSSFNGLGTYTPNTQDSFTPGAPRTVYLGVNYQF